jgi:hypothetical protein
MSNAAFAAIGAIGGAIITGLSALAISLYQKSSAQHDAHLRRAFERHLTAYERIFVTCRSTVDALTDYMTVESKVARRDDPFLFQLLDILKDNAYSYCVAVDWRHNPAMGYLELALEEKCLHLRDLLLEWLSITRITAGDIITLRRDGRLTLVTPDELSELQPADYGELIIERHSIVLSDPRDNKLAADIQLSVNSVIKDLREVMAY